MTERKPLLADHHCVGKIFIPPAPWYGCTEIHYVERILPEIAWIEYFVKCFGAKRGIETIGIFIESCYFLKEWGQKSDFSLLSNYRIMDPADWAKFQKHLKAKAIFLDCL